MAYERRASPAGSGRSRQRSSTRAARPRAGPCRNSASPSCPSLFTQGRQSTSVSNACARRERPRFEARATDPHKGSARRPARRARSSRPSPSPRAASGGRPASSRRTPRRVHRRRRRGRRGRRGPEARRGRRRRPHRHQPEWWQQRRGQQRRRARGGARHAGRARR